MRGEKEELQRLLIDNAISLGLIAVVIVLAYQVFSPLFPAILWGVLLAVICAHPYERLVSRLHGRRTLADIAFGFILILVLLLPALFFAWELIVYFPVLSAWLHATSEGPPPSAPDWMLELPIVGPPIRSALGATETDLEAEIPGLLSHFGGVALWTTQRIGTFSGFLFEFILGAAISLFILHYRFKVRAFLNRLLRRTGGDLAGTLFSRALETTRTAFAAVIYAAIAQTLLAGIALYLAGLPAIILFAGFTFLLALVQIGALVVLLVADTILLLEGAHLKAFLVTIWFLGVVMTADNFIKPYISSKGSNVPAIVLLLGTIGGFLSWGLIGVFLGPVLTSVLYEMLLAWMNRIEAENVEKGL